MNKQQAIEAVENADINQYGWFTEIIEKIESAYARGYLACFTSNLSESICSDDEEYREELLEIMEQDIFE